MVKETKHHASKPKAMDSTDAELKKNAKMKEDKNKPLTKAELKEKRAAKKAKQEDKLKAMWKGA